MLSCLNYISLLFCYLLCAFVTYFIKYRVTVTVLYPRFKSTSIPSGFQYRQHSEINDCLENNREDY